MNYAFSDTYDDPVILLETNAGNIVIEVFPYDAPKPCSKFS